MLKLENWVFFSTKEEQVQIILEVNATTDVERI